MESPGGIENEVQVTHPDTASSALIPAVASDAPVATAPAPGPSAPAPIVPPAIPETIRTQAAEALAAAPASPELRVRWNEVALGCVTAVWAAGVLVGLARFAAGWHRLSRICRAARPLDTARHGAALAQACQRLSIAERPTVVTSPEVAGPVAAGLFRPQVVLPEELAEALPADELCDVLVHEYAHLLRRDPWVGLLQRLAGILFWPHPLVHYLNAELARAREEVCDNFVLRGGDPVAYARTLLDLTERCHPFGSPLTTAGLLGSRWTLADRVAGLLDTRRTTMTRTNARSRLATAVALAATGLTLAGVRPLAPVEAKGSPAAAADDTRSIDGVVLDEDGRPVAGAVVRAVLRDSDPGAVTALDGAFRLPIRGFVRLQEDLVAEADGGARQGVGRFEEPRDVSRPAEKVKIVMKPARIVTVRVKDASGAAVSGATVAAVSFDYQGQGTTGADGSATLRVAADAKIHWIVGLKIGVGFDYFENYKSRPFNDTPLPPAEVTLTLDGARTVRVKAVDTAGKPVPGVVFAPWYIGRPRKMDQANIGGSAAVRATTDAAGVAVFDWLPKYVEPGVPFLSWPGAVYSCPKSPVYEPGGPSELTATLLRDTRLSGVVRMPDGKPAARILIQAEGRGATNHPGRLYARTGDDGTYTLDVPSEQSYIVSVYDATWAARARTGVVVREGKPQGSLDFTLGTGTLLRGRITEGPGHTPVARKFVALIQEGEPLPKELQGPHGEGPPESLVRSAKTDAEGRYQFRVGPGTFKLHGADFGAPVTVKVETMDGAEVVRDFTAAASEAPKVIIGVVVEETAIGRKPVAGATVEGVRGGLRDFTAVADADGRFRAESLFVGPRLRSPFIVFARSPDGKLAGFTPLPDDAKDGTAFVAEAARVSGRVVDKLGKPVAGRRVQFRIHSGKDENSSAQVFRQLWTDEDGLYAFAGAVVGARGEASVSHPKSGSERGGRVEVTRFEVAGPDPVELPDLVVPASEGDEVKESTGVVAVGAVKGPADRPVPVPAGPSRAEVEALLRTIGRDPVTPELVDRVALWYHPLFVRWNDFERTRRQATDPEFVPRLDALASVALGHPADTLTLLKLAQLQYGGYDDAALTGFLRDGDRERKQKELTIEGKVSDAGTGKPLVGARVFTSEAVTRTDASGTFMLRSPPGRNGGAMSVFAEADGYAYCESVVQPGGAANLTMRLVREVPLDGQVIDRDRKPVAGAVVRAWVDDTAITLDVSKSPLRGGTSKILVVRTDDRGWFSVRGVPPTDGHFLVEVFHPRFQTCVVRPASGTTPVVTLEPGCTVAGVVVDERGHPVTGAMVQVRKPSRLNDAHSDFTDARGRFRFESVSPGLWDVVVEPERFAPAFAPVVAQLDRPVENQFVVGAGTYIRGQVNDADGSPVAGAAVGWVESVGGGFPELNRMTKTAADGTFRLGPLPLGEFRITGLAQSPRRLGKVDARANQNDAVIRLEPDPIR
jgi:beta-lactamase regulating signal transducer with metallopeptidase domain/uncharacterized GH25 family protein